MGVNLRWIRNPAFSERHFCSVFFEKVSKRERAMVLVLDGSSDIGIHERRSLCLRHLLGSRIITKRMFFLFSFMRAQHDLSDHLISAPWRARFKFS